MGYIWLFGQSQIGLKYGHDGYPGQEGKKTRLPVKTRTQLDVCIKSYCKNEIFEILPYVTPYVKIKRCGAKPNDVIKI